MLNRPTYSIINIGGLAVGMACFIVIMLWVKHEYSYNNFHFKANRIYRVAFTNDKGDFHGYSQTGQLASYLRNVFPEIIHSTSFRTAQCKIAYKTKGFNCNASFADSSFFEMFTYPIIIGDDKNALKQPNTLVITKSLSLRLFGNENPIGKMVNLNEESNYTIDAVIEDVPLNSDMKFDLLIPFCNTHDWMRTWDSKWTNTYVLLQNENQVEDVNKKIAGVMNKFQPAWKNILYLVPFTKSHLYDLNGRGLIVYIWIFSFMALLVLLLACINFMNLSTSCYDLRRKEIFVKKVSGSNRIQVLLQFLFEAMMFSILSLIVAVLLAKGSLSLVNKLLYTNINLEFSPFTIFLLLIIAGMTGIISGSYPAFYMSKIIPKRIPLISHQKRGFSIKNFRHALVVFQFVISIFFICCTLLTFNQIRYLQIKDLGIKKDNIIKLNTLGKLNEKAVDLKRELLKNPNIESVTVSNTDLTSWNNSGPLDWAGRDNNELLEIGYNWVDCDFIKTFELKMKEGRFFSKNFASDNNAFVLNEKAVSYLKLKEPLGMKVKSWFGVEGTIIGIVKDFHTTSLHEELGPIAMLVTDKSNFMFISIRGNDVSKTTEFINKKVKEFVPDDPFTYQFLDEQLDHLYQTEALSSKIAIALTCLSIFISCMGLWGLVLSTLQRYTKEIGIRKVNGAKVSEILIMLNKDFIEWVVIAFFIACPIAWYAMNKWLQNFAYKTELSWWVFATAGAVAVVVAVLTVSWQSWRAATRNPVEALRYE